ncbi:MAG: sugar phosphate isomerase/epimerase [Chthonomonadales bacterium]|nr:sugar phosphate isomerase/epimerase [Chthonomonadales bacterium]
MAAPKIAIQLIVFGDRVRTDVDAVLAETRAAGFSAIEAGNLIATNGEGTVRELMNRHEISVCGAHFGYGDFADPGHLATNTAYCQTLGIRNMICSGVGDPTTADGYIASARLFNEVGARLRQSGIAFHYHNHAWEFTDLGGVCGMDILEQETDPDLVRFNVDVFWVMVGGRSPSEFIRRHADRATYFHFKDGRRLADGSVEFCELGQGEVDLIEAAHAARAAGAEWIVAEQDQTSLTPLRSATISGQYLSQNLAFG